MRLNTAKFLTALVVTIAVFSHHIYQEGGLVNLALETLGGAALFVSALGRVWAAAYIAGKKNRELVTSGPYSISRHPLYFFTALGFLGAGLALESLILTALFLVVFLITHCPAIHTEEQHLMQEFGEAYRQYAACTPRLWPGWRSFHTVAEGTISYAIFTRALLDASLIGLIYPATHLLEWAHIRHLLPVIFRLY